MATLAEVRSKFPAYADLPDEEFADKVYSRFYSDMPRAEFNKKIGTDSDPAGIKGKSASARRYGLVDEVVRGATFGFSDELGAGVRAGVRGLVNMAQGKSPNFSDNYGRAVDEERDAAKAYTEENPASSATANIIGGLLTGGPVVKGVAAGAGARPGIAALAGKAAGTGAAFGAASGFGEANGDLTNRAEGALTGGALGGVVGGALAPAARLAAPAINRGLQAVGLRRPESVAQDLLLRAFERDNTDPQRAMTQLRDAARAGKPAAMFDVGGENTRRLARSAGTIPGDATDQAVTMLAERQAGQRERVASDAARLLSPSNDFYGTMEQLAARRTAEAAPLYERAYAAGPVWNDDLQSLVGRPAMRQAMARAYRIAAEEGRDPRTLNLIETPNGDVVFGDRVPTMHTWDYVKRGLDDVIEQFRDRTTGRLVLDESGRAINSTRASLLNMLDEANPAYREARAAWAGPSQARDAMELGRDFFKMDAEQVQRRLAGMSESEREFFRAGAVRSVQDRMSAAPDGADVVKRIFGTPKMRAQLAAAFPDQETFRVFERQMRREADLYRNAQFVNPRTGPQTANRLKDDEDMAQSPVAGVLGALMNPQGGMWGAAVRGSQELMKRGQGLNNATADALGPMMFSANPADTARILLELSRRARAVQKRGSDLRDLGRGVMPALGYEAGSLSNP